MLQKFFCTVLKVLIVHHNCEISATLDHEYQQILYGEFLLLFRHR